MQYKVQRYFVIGNPQSRFLSLLFFHKFLTTDFIFTFIGETNIFLNQHDEIMDNNFSEIVAVIILLMIRYKFLIKI